MGLILAFLGALFSLGFGMFILLFINFIFGAPFQPSNENDVSKMIELLKIKPGERAIDLGSGDGRIVRALAKAGAEAHGYEINPFLVLWSRRVIKKQGLEKRAFIHWKNFWEADFSKFDVISLFQIGYVMRRLEKRLRDEAKENVRIVSNVWKFPNWKHLKRREKIYLYKKRVN